MECLLILGLRLWGGGFGFDLEDHPCCLTIESEEREAWTADVLADGTLVVSSKRHSDGHVF